MRNTQSNKCIIIYNTTVGQVGCTCVSKLSKFEDYCFALTIFMIMIMWPILSKWDSSVLCTWSKLSSCIIIKVYILPFLTVVRSLKSDNPKQSYAHLTFGYWKIWNGESAVKVLSLSLDQLPSRPEIIKIIPFRLQISIQNFHSAFKIHKQLWFCKNLNIGGKNHPHRYFQAYLHWGSCTKASHFDRMDHKLYAHYTSFCSLIFLFVLLAHLWNMRLSNTNITTFIAYHAETDREWKKKSINKPQK